MSESKIIITEREVAVYREIYYETVKPMLISGKSQDEIKVAIKYVSEEFEITPERFQDLHTIDLFQRMAGWESNRTFISTGDGAQPIPTSALKECVLSMPELRCPRRSEQKVSVYTKAIINN